MNKAMRSYLEDIVDDQFREIANECKTNPNQHLNILKNLSVKKSLSEILDISSAANTFSHAMERSITNLHKLLTDPANSKILTSVKETHYGKDPFTEDFLGEVKEIITTRLEHDIPMITMFMEQLEAVRSELIAANKGNVKSEIHPSDVVVQAPAPAPASPPVRELAPASASTQVPQVVHYFSSAKFSPETKYHGDNSWFSSELPPQAEDLWTPHKEKPAYSAKELKPVIKSTPADSSGAFFDTTSAPIPQEHIFKFGLFGDTGVGKTNLLLRFCDGTFCDDYISTIGVDYKIRTIEIARKAIKLQIWDNQCERFKTITSNYFRGFKGVILVFDLTDSVSFNNIKTWKEETGRYALENTKYILVGCKSDLENKRSVDYDVAKKLADSLGMTYIETSAKKNINVAEVFTTLAQQYFDANFKSEPLVTPTPTKTEKKEKSCSVM